MTDACPDIAALRAALAEAETRAAAAEAEAARVTAAASSAEAMIAHLKLEIEKLRRALYGRRSERKARLLDQLELQLASGRNTPDRCSTNWSDGCMSSCPGSPARRRLPRRSAMRSPA